MTTILSEREAIVFQNRGLLAADTEPEPKPKPSKYRNKRCEIHTPSHQSGKECQRFQDLQKLERAGKIRHLRQQARFHLCQADCLGQGRHIAYVCDFMYEEHDIGDADYPERWTMVVEDVKSPITRQNRVYQLKRHLMEAKGLTIREV